MPGFVPWIIAAVLAVVAILILLVSFKRASRIKQMTAQLETAKRQKKDTDAKIKALKDDKQQIEGRLHRLEWDTMPRLREQLQECRMQSAVQQQEAKKVAPPPKAVETTGENREQVAGLQQQIQQLTISVRTHEQMLQQTRDQVSTLTRQIDDTVERDGRFWARPLYDDAPVFEPLATRRTPIISLVNLRIGVGEGPLTAGLGKALAAMGKKVLLIDLDPARSLTKSCVSDAMPALLAKEHRTLQHFFLWPKPDINYVFNGLVEAEKVPGCHVLVNSEKVDSSTPGIQEPNLEEADLQLLGKWLGDPLCDDVRLFLRAALHTAALRQRYDYVLLSCPPRLSTSCMNALAASDFAIIPTALDNPGAESTHNLLRKMNEYQRGGLLKSLRILGILAEHAPVAATSSFEEPELGFWKSLQESTADVWGEALPFFSTAIPKGEQDLSQVFTAWAQEVSQKVEEQRQELEKAS